MTAISLIVQEGAAHLVTDASFYDGAGCIVQLRSKVSIALRFRMAVACSGCVDRNRIATGLEGARSQAEAIARLPRIVKALRLENDALNPDGAATDHNNLMVFAAIWHDERDCAEGWIVSSAQGYLGAEYCPYTLLAVEKVVSPPVASVEASNFDPSVDPCRILLEQRAFAEADGCSIVGGWGEHTIVSRNGVRQHRIIEWPDAIGQRVAA